LRLVHDLSEREQLEAAGWFAWYDLKLYSNFTFFLDDPVNGDQIVQRDHRTLYGGWLRYSRDLEATPIPVVFRTGLWTRSDDADVRLSHASDRDFVSPISEDHVRETSLAGWAEVEALPLPWVRTVLGLRGEEFWYDVGDRSGLGRPDGHERNHALLPKASVILRPFGADGPLASEIVSLRELELFLNYGVGIHSNDARDVVANGDEVTLPEADGYEVGVRTRFFERLDVAVAYWWLNSESEFVFIGDAGTTEAKPSSRRQGVELSSELQIVDWLFWRGDLAYSSGEFQNGDKIPQAVRFIANTSLVAQHPSGVSAEVDYLTLGERYGTESVSGERLRSWGVCNATLRYRRGPIEVAFQVENVFDSDWESAEFFFPSRLPGEPVDGVDDLHLVPGNDRNFRGWISYYF
jgi:outer membrane receptor protein involved in Fe transport